MSEYLDPLRIPLHGSRLIEASAGTGKTWTIAALYLRLVLGHGESGHAFPRALGPEQILVMTFTRAATKELSDRIRTRLASAAACFRGERAVDRDDVFLQSLLAAYPPGKEREQAAWQLEAAADAMDAAAVFTIDAWCQRMLREHAFDSGSLFDEELIADDSAIVRQAARDIWRQEVYPLRGRTLAAVLGIWGDVEAFAAAVRNHAQVRDASPDSLGTLWEREMASRSSAQAALKQAWSERSPVLRSWLLGHLPPHAAVFKANQIDPAKVNAWFDAIDAWRGAEDMLHVDLPDTAWKRLSAEGLRSALKKGETVEIPAAFDAFGDLAAELGAQGDVKDVLRQAAAARFQRRVRELKETARTYGFTDMQERLDAALAGPRGAQLRARIGDQYPVALIDEFQDTSSLQFSLFDRIYNLARTPGDRAIFLIGDPKQSIYAFRNADIHSYIHARHATAGRHYALGTNFRSTQALVAAINRLFQEAEDRSGPGAFQFRAAGDNPVPFIPVHARGLDKTFVRGRSEIPAVRCVYSVDLISMGAVRERYAELAAEDMVNLLNAAQCGFRCDDGRAEPLRPADIAVLVRSKAEADAVRGALRRRGVASVYLSERDSVFFSSEAADLLRWLRAAAQPRDAQLARAAFAVPMLGLGMPELAALATDDALFEARSELLAELHGVWQRQGVLPMLRQMLHRLDLPARWLQEDDGERRLTNVLHLAEILQQASAGIEGEQALVRWFAQALEGQAGQSEDEQLRLESEADLVKVVTIHKSKGLEYPVVYLPFASNFREAQGDEGQAGPAADDVRLQEDIRLLYVALTRAKHALWIGLAAAKKGNGKYCVLHRSAPGYLLGGSDPLAGEAIPGLLQHAFGSLPQVRLEEATQTTGVTALARPEASAALVDAPIYAGEFERNWSISSFSALVRDLAAPGEAREVELRNLEDDVAQDGAWSPSQIAPWHTFPQGAFAGKFLHDQLAWLAEQGFRLAGNPALQDRLAQRCMRMGWGNRAQEVDGWLGDLLATPLPPLGAPLQQLEHFIAEMEFWFPVNGTSAATIDAICAQCLSPDQPRAPLTPRMLRGLLMGFTDLVFEWEGKWWVLDYKSNALGGRDDDYAEQALGQAVAAHRYDVQAMIYLLALHRLLRSRLGPGYDPARQLGGAIVLFMRGFRGPASGCFTMPANLVRLEQLEAAMAQPDEEVRA